MSEQSKTELKEKKLEALRKKSRIIREINLFFDNLHALKNSYPDFIKNLNTEHLIKKRDLERALQRYGKKKKTENMYLIPQRSITLINKHLRNYRMSKMALEKTIPESFFVSLISIFDGFMCNLVKMYLRHNTDLILSDTILPEDDESTRDKNRKIKLIDYKEIFKFKSINEIKDWLIEKEVDVFSRSGGHSKQLDWLKKKFNFEIEEGVFNISKFIEITERRNLYVHNAGYISNQYLIMCQKYKVTDVGKLKIGDYLPVNEEYFLNSFDTIFEVGIKLAHLIWRQIIPKELALADNNLGIDICFRLIDEGDYKRAITMLEFATSKFNTYSNDVYRRIYIINRSLAYKLSGNKIKAIAFLDSEDWSACADRFRLAVAVIKEEYDKAAQLMKKIGSKNINMPQEAYIEWPLFKEFRKTKIFIKTYKQVFKEDLKKYLQKNAKNASYI